MALMAMAPSLSGAGSSGSTTPFLLSTPLLTNYLTNYITNQLTIYRTHRTRFFVECVYGRDAARTGSLPGPSPFFDQAFKLPLDGRASSVAITLKRERSGGKEPAAGPAIAADPESSLGSSFSSRRGSMVDVPFEDASEAARREDEEDDVPPRRERIKEAPLPLPAPGDAAAEGKRGFACGSIGALLGCLPPNVSNPERGGTTESWTCRWGFWDAKL
eukprot:tig00021015_g17159.t1